MTQFKKGDEVFAKGEVFHYSNEGHIWIRIPVSERRIDRLFCFKSSELIPASTLDVNKGLLDALKALVKAKNNGFHPMKINGSEWFTAERAIAMAETEDDISEFFVDID